MKKQDSYRILAPYYDILIDWNSRLQREIPFLLEVAGQAGRGMRAFDVGCGTGRHLKALQKAGFKVEGAELSKELRLMAEHNLKGVTVHAAPMESLAELSRVHGPWHLVTCLGNTLAHLPPDKLPEFCRGVAGALDRQGAAVLHLLGYEKIMAGRPEQLPLKKVVSGKDRYRFERRYDYKEDRIEFNIQVWKNEKHLASDREILYPLTGHMLLAACKNAGLTDIDLFGDFNFSVPYSSRSDNLVAVIRKS
jgi:SAM-dependent methyltransferase